MLELEQQFAGVTDPKQMGTTGLLAWVSVAGGIRLWTRFRSAVKIVRERGLPVQRFVNQLIRQAPCVWRRERIEAYSRKVLKHG